MLVDERHMERDESGFSAVRELASFAVPPTIHALLAARLDRLEPGRARGGRGRRGRRAAPSAAAAVLELGRGGDRAELDLSPERARAQAADRARRRALRGRAHVQLQAHPRPRRGLPRDPQGPARRPATRASRTGSSARRGSGRTSTRRSSATTSSGPTATWPSSGRSTSEAGRWPRRAAARLGSSGARALARGDIRPAVNLLERAVSLLPRTIPRRRDLTVKLGIALAETGQLSRADALLARPDRGRAEGQRTSWSSTTARGKQHVVDLPRGPPDDHRRAPARQRRRARPGTTRSRAGTRELVRVPGGLDAVGRRLPQRLLPATASA